MDSSLSHHLEQLSVTSESLASITFAPPKIFTNAILRSRDIISMLRDTDAHERALFTVTAAQKVAPEKAHSSAHRKSVAPGPARRNTAVHAVLGGDMIEQLRRGGGGGAGGGIGGVSTGEVDVELLLHGVEKLTSVYHISSAASRIARAKERFEQLTESIANYEALFEAQRVQLELAQQNDDFVMGDVEPVQPEPETTTATDLMIEKETGAIRELENKKEELEMRLKSLDRQLASTYQTA